MQHVWQRIIKMNLVGGELEMYNDPGPRAFRCRIKEIRQTGVPGQAHIESDWMAGLDLTNGRPWTKFSPHLPRTVGLMIVSEPKILDDDRGVMFRAMAIDTEMMALLPRDIFRCVIFTPGGSTVNFNGRDDESYDPYEGRFN